MTTQKSVLFLLLVLFSPFVFGLDAEYKVHVEKFIKSIAERDIEALSSITRFPLHREKPIPPITNKQELKERFDQVFDKKLYDMIVKSDPAKSWSKMGWRGIMLDHGSVWLDTDGKLIKINYQSAVETKLRDALIRQGQSRLHPSIAKFHKPEHVWATKKFLIRIDDIGGSNFRYAVWPVSKTMADKPDLVLEKGKVVFDGSGGNHYYEFKNGIYTYRCFVSIIGESDSLGSLTVYKRDKQILQQEILKSLD